MKKSNSDKEMTESEISMRKFLKQLGVTSHQKIEQKLDELMASGKLSPNEEIQIIANVEIPKIDFSHSITSTILLPDK